MSGVFMDGGGDSSGFGGEGIDHGGHDHGSHGVHHGHGQGGHNFLAQILGLDQQDHAHLAHHGGEGAEGAAPSQTPSWNSALQGLKLENLVAGINITPNFLLFMLFASFVGWLGVIYWIRHHEPFANQVLGSTAAYAPTAGADRRLINDARDANPVKTSAGSGVVYCPEPMPNNQTPAAGSPVNARLSAAMGAAQVGSNTVYSQQPTQNNQNPAAGSPVNAGLSAAMGASSAQTGKSPAAQPLVVKYAEQPASGSPVNTTLSQAMAESLGAVPGGPPATAAPSQPAMAQAMPQSMPQSLSQFMPQSMSGPMPARMTGGGFGAGEGGMRLFSSRRSMMAQAPASMPAPRQVQPGMYGQPQSQASSPGQYPQPAPQAVPQPIPQAAVRPAENPNAWSLATQGSGTFSSDTAQFSSQFGAPLLPDASQSAAGPGLPGTKVGR